MHTGTDRRSLEPASATLPFWLTPTAYWTPLHLPTSAWYTHTPFAAWLMDVLSPRVIVELGTHYGCSCFAFAEAAKRLGNECVVHAVDTWEGDDHAGFYGQEVHDYVRSVVEAEYADSVNLIRGRFDQARPLFPDGSVDLLHIDGRHAYEDAVADFDEWRSAVGDGGIILFHDIAEHDNGFGVWRLWDEIARPGESFAFSHGHGLGVLAVGPVVHPALEALFRADEETSGRIRDDFERLGARVQRLAELQGLPHQLEHAHGEIERRMLHEQELEGLVNWQAEYIDALKGSTSWRLTAPLRAVGRLKASRN